MTHPENHRENWHVGLDKLTWANPEKAIWPCTPTDLLQKHKGKKEMSKKVTFFNKFWVSCSTLRKKEKQRKVFVSCSQYTDLAMLSPYVITLYQIFFCIALPLHQ